MFRLPHTPRHQSTLFSFLDLPQVQLVLSISVSVPVMGTQKGHSTPKLTLCGHPGSEMCAASKSATLKSSRKQMAMGCGKPLLMHSFTEDTRQCWQTQQLLKLVIICRLLKTWPGAARASAREVPYVLVLTSLP